MVESITCEGMDMKPSRFTEEQIIGILREQEQAQRRKLQRAHRSLKNPRLAGVWQGPLKRYSCWPLPTLAETSDNVLRARR
jgi:hypothetical protein